MAKKLINDKNEGAIAGALTGVTGMLGSASTQSLSSPYGDILSGAGDLAAAIPGVGLWLGPALKAAGALTTAAIGTATDEEALSTANMGTAALNSYTSNAGTFDELQGPQAQAGFKDPYKGGFLVQGTTNAKNAKVRQDRIDAQNYAQGTYENAISNIESNNINNMLSQSYALGGPLFSNGADWTNGVTKIGNGETHEQNPFGGVPMGMAEDGQPNLVEEGELIFNDYVFSNRLKVPKAIRTKYKLRGPEKLTFAKAAEKIQKESEERPNDPISKRTLTANMQRLMVSQEEVRERNEMRKNRKLAEENADILAEAYAHGGPMGHYFDGLGEDSNVVKAIRDRYKGASYDDPNYRLFLAPPSFGSDKPSINLNPIPSIAPLRVTPTRDIQPLRNTIKKLQSQNNNTDSTDRGNWLTGLRYVPAFGAGVNAFTDMMGWTNKPDYSSADAIVRAANNIGNVGSTPIGDYMTYTPFDRMFYANQLGAQAGATRRYAVNTSGGNRATAMSGLLAADYNTQTQLGDLYRKAEEYNLNERKAVADFNKSVNVFNAENALKAQIANKEDAKIKVSALSKAAALRDQIDQRVGTSRSTNLTNFVQSLGNIGIDAYNRADRDMLIRTGAFGTLAEKPQDWSDARWNTYQKAISGEGFRNGGKLKKKKGITV